MTWQTEMTVLATRCGRPRSAAVQTRILRLRWKCAVLASQKAESRGDQAETARLTLDIESLEGRMAEMRRQEGAR